MNTTSPELPVAAPIKDRRTGLIVFGILEMILGALCLLLVAVMFFGQTMQARFTGAPPDYRMILPAAVMYVALAAFFVGLGIGSTLARRWARALSLILGWSWLVVGLATMVSYGVFFPRVLAAAHPPNQAMPEGMLWVIGIITFGVLFLFFVAAPAGLVLFYRSRHVKATCETRDPVTRWTDRCPLPVLAVSLWLALGALTLLMVPIGYRGVLPLFGVLISGLPGTVLCLALAVLWAYLAWASYRTRPHAWWITAGLLCLFTVSAMITFGRVDLMEMYRLMGYPEAQIEQIQRFNFFDGATLTWWSAACLVPLLAYLLWVKRFFQ